MNSFVVAIDGPVAAGKTTLGRALAKQVEAIFFDTGILYRAMAHRVIAMGVAPECSRDVASIARKLEARLVNVEGESRLVVSDRDITDELRSPSIDRALPAISANPEVRFRLLAMQRDVVAGRRSVVVGRDIGTVVFPDADFKIYLDAAQPVRAMRRFSELQTRGVDITFDEVLADLRARDKRDVTRTHAPLAIADDATVIDASERDIQTLVRTICALLVGRGILCRT